MKLLAPIAAFIAAASAGQIYTGKSAESYAQSAEQYQSALEFQQNGLYSEHSQAPQTFTGHEAAYSSRPSGEKTARILGFNIENNGHQYQYSYETENGIKAEEAGQTSEHGTVTHGAYSYKGDDGQTYTVTYTADEHGFHPQGAHLPTPPPIPDEIQKSLEQNARDEAAGIFDDGKYKEQSGQGMAHGFQQYDAGYQGQSGHASGAELAYHIPSVPSGHASGADLAYHAHSGNALTGIVSSGHALSSHGNSGHSSGPQSLYNAPSGHGSSTQLAFHTPSNLGSSARLYNAPSGHDSNAQLAYQASLGHASSAQIAHHFPSGHGSSPQLAYHAPSGHISSAQTYNAHTGYAHSGYASGPELAYHGHH